jgi:hypothetical protein
MFTKLKNKLLPDTAVFMGGYYWVPNSSPVKYKGGRFQEYVMLKPVFVFWFKTNTFKTINHYP